MAATTNPTAQDAEGSGNVVPVERPIYAKRKRHERSKVPMPEKQLDIVIVDRKWSNFLACRTQSGVNQEQ